MTEVERKEVVLEIENKQEKLVRIAINIPESKKRCNSKSCSKKVHIIMFQSLSEQELIRN